MIIKTKQKTLKRKSIWTYVYFLLIHTVAQEMSTNSSMISWLLVDSDIFFLACFSFFVFCYIYIYIYMSVHGELSVCGGVIYKQRRRCMKLVSIVIMILRNKQTNTHKHKHTHTTTTPSGQTSFLIASGV
jgi:lipopolysaccharide/colanic/teichoic acid biosynthesis glycosyltransferase